MTPPRTPDAPPQADLATPVAPRATTRRFDGLRKASDRVPTKWFAAIATALFLGVTAGFGGLAQVAAAPIPQLDIGETHRSAQLDITVERAVLIDSLTEAGAATEDGERVLAVVLEARNAWDHPLGTADQATFSTTLRLEGMPDVAPDSVARYDDATVNPWLQPDVPAKVVATWAVPKDRYVDGDEVMLQISDLTLFTGSSVLYGYYWSDPTLAATVRMPLTDIGAGVNAE